MKIVVYDKLVYIQEAEKDILKQIDNLLSYKIDGAFFSPAYRMGRWDGKNHLFNNRTKSFSIGLLYRLLSYLDSEKIEYEIEDKSEFKTNFKQEYLNGYNDFKLREYQKESINKYLDKYWNLTNRRGIFNLPPRSGKTLLSGFLGLVLNEYPLMFVVHKIDLAYQTKKVFDKLFGFDCGIVGDGQFNIDSSIVISTIQSISKTYDIKLKKDDELDYGIEQDIPNKDKFKIFISKVKTLIGDECHISSSDTFQALIKELQNVKFMIGLSGTPYREDKSDMLIENMFGSIIYTYPRENAVKEGFVLPIKSYFIHLPEIKVSKTDVQTMKREAVNENDYIIDGVVKLVKRMEKKGMSSVIMVRELSQGDKIYERLKCVYLNGKVSGKEREIAYKRLERKEILTIISTVTDIGVDIPTLDCVIVAGITKSKTLALQRVRCGTPDGKKTHGRIFVFCPKISNDINKEKKYVENWWKTTMRHYKKEDTFTVKEMDYKEL